MCVRMRHVFLEDEGIEDADTTVTLLCDGRDAIAMVLERRGCGVAPRRCVAPANGIDVSHLARLVYDFTLSASSSPSVLSSSNTPPTVDE